MSTDWLWFALPLLAIILERIVPLPIQWHPLRGIDAIAILLAARVNRAKNGPKQQRLAGHISLTIVLILFLVTYGALQVLAVTPWLLDTVLLYLLLQWHPIERDCGLIFTQLKSQRTQQARQMLRPWVLRDVDELSPSGIARAAVEMLVLRLARSWFSVLFWYALGGVGAALGYRVIYQLHLNWNRKQTGFSQFSQSTRQLFELLSWIPLHLLALILCCYGSIRANWRSLALGFRWPSPASGTLLSITSTWLQAELGGPRVYQDQRVNFPLFGPKDAPVEPAQMATVRLRLNLAAGMFILILLPLMFGRYAFL
jgi:adenosylcobinamide-phosphate synthase